MYCLLSQIKIIFPENSKIFLKSSMYVFLYAWFPLAIWRDFGDKLKNYHLLHLRFENARKRKQTQTQTQKCYQVLLYIRYFN